MPAETSPPEEPKQPADQLRVATFNVAYRGNRHSPALGKLIADLRVDLVLLQEANLASLASLCHHASLDWAVSAYDAGATTDKRKRTCAIAGRGPRPDHLQILDRAPFPEKMVAARISSIRGDFVAASYHAPTGVRWGYRKVEQALLLLDWVNEQTLPVVLGVDANTPRVDHPDPTRTQTHWHTGLRKLDGRPGDDAMFGGEPAHGLRDAYRRWLARNPEAFAQIQEARPDGPLAVSHIAGRRRDGHGAPRRFDILWLSDDFDVSEMAYFYDEAVLAGSDHALVVASLRRPPRHTTV